MDMSRIINKEATIAAMDYVRDYRDVSRFEAMCAQCGSYGRVWSCPPFERELDLRGYKTVRLFGSQAFFEAELRERVMTAEERKRVTAQVLDEMWAELLPRLYKLERRNAGSRIFTGRCRLCRPAPCSRVEGRPCRHPDEVRSSLEAVGFDVVKTARDLLGIELLWSTDGHLPEYVMLITAIFLK